MLISSRSSILFDVLSTFQLKSYQRMGVVKDCNLRTSTCFQKFCSYPLSHGDPLPQCDARDSRGRSPLGVAMWAGHSNVVAALLHEKPTLTDEGKNGFG